jgi:sugar phosphate isomerase/epimerase
MDRQSFLRMAGAGMASAAISHDLLARSIQPPARLSIQLYTVRDDIEKDLEGTIGKIAERGFKYVETAFWPKDVSHERAASVIKKAGLKVSSCHVELPLGDHRITFSQTAKVFGCNRVIWHGWPEDKRYGTFEGTKELIGIYNETAAYAKSLGLEFGLHNHWWEFRNRVADKPVYEWLLALTDPSIFFEIDTYWVKVAGVRPSDVIKKVGSRAKFLHIKDGPAMYHDNLAEDNPDPMTAVGKGTQDIPAIVAAATHADFLVVEMDKVQGNVFALLKESYDYLHHTFGLR